MSGPTSAYLVVIVAMIAASSRADAVAGAPTAVIIAVGRVVAAVVSNAALNADTSYFTSTQQQRCHRAETTCQQSTA
jgi:flagellar motor component MotA